MTNFRASFLPGKTPLGNASRTSRTRKAFSRVGKSAGSHDKWNAEANRSKSPSHRRLG